MHALHSHFPPLLLHHHLRILLPTRTRSQYSSLLVCDSLLYFYFQPFLHHHHHLPLPPLPHYPRQDRGTLQSPNISGGISAFDHCEITRH